MNQFKHNVTESIEKRNSEGCITRTFIRRADSFKIQPLLSRELSESPLDRGEDGFVNDFSYDLRQFALRHGVDFRNDSWHLMLEKMGFSVSSDSHEFSGGEEFILLDYRGGIEDSIPVSLIFELLRGIAHEESYFASVSEDEKQIIFQDGDQVFPKK